MAKKRKRSRRRNTFSVINALEAYVYATILTEGVAGTSPIGLLTGATDIGQTLTTTQGRIGKRKGTAMTKTHAKQEDK